VSTRRRFLVAAGAGMAGAWSTGCRPFDLPGLGDPPPPSGPFAPPTGAAIDLVGHVLNRCTFGVRPGDRGELGRRGASDGEAVDAWLADQLRPEGIDDHLAESRVRAFGSVLEPRGELFEYKKPVLLRDLVRATLLRAVSSRRQLQEVMVEFWTDHFNIDASKGDCAWLKAADDREVIRAHALGRFSALLRASALSPAMLSYLDGRENKRSRPDEKPNENYARELLELHTLGVHGGYTQHDVMEVARCLTGWTVRGRDGFRKGAVEFRPEHHDDGEKAVLGRRIPAALGPGDLDRVLDLVATHPATGRHLAGKLCRRFIADDPPASVVEAVAAAFRASRGSIAATLSALFARPEFRGEPEDRAPLRGAKLKRPFHYLVSALRATDAETDFGSPLVESLTAMGQAPFQYPTPDGYPTAPEAWRGSLLWRWKLAKSLGDGALPGTRIDFAQLRRRAGGDMGLMNHLLGRRPRPDESRAWSSAGGGGAGLALLLAAPAFQRF
jgi:uncharacterized protein (DUF1800 family)